MIIDTHHHFWHYTADEYGWIPDSMSGIRRDYLPGDLAQQIRAAGVDQVVSVQSRQSFEETAFLIEHAAANDFIAGVVAWFPLASPAVEKVTGPWFGNKAIVGARHVVQGEPGGFLLGDDFNRGIDLLTRHHLAYDILIFERQLPETIAFVDRHPNQVFIVDHMAKPRNDADEIEPWRSRLAELARRPNVYCKISGGVTEIDLEWTPARLIPYFDATLDAFGPSRVMFGSNWPLTEAAGGYAAWLDAVKQWAAKLSESEQNDLFAGVAARAYRLEKQP